MPLTVLFVDDEPMVLDGIRRVMHPLRAEFTTMVASSGADALALFSGQPIDVLVSDLRMPEMDGRSLLRAVRARFPKTLRFILSGQADRVSLIDAVGCANQVLSKPCEPERLRACIRRAMQLREALAVGESLARVASIDSLPAMPAAFAQLLEQIQSPDASLGEVASIIKKDLALTAAVLKVANSAYFGAARATTSLERACTLLGLSVLSGIALSHGVVAARPELFQPGAPLSSLPEHSQRVALLARALALGEGLPRDVAEEAFTCGLLHDLGEMVIELQRADHGGPESAPVPVADHALIGAYLLAIWGFPDALVEAVAWHETAEAHLGEPFGLAQVVYAAGKLVEHPQCRSPAEAGIAGAFVELPAFQDRWRRFRAAAESIVGSVPGAA